MSRRRERGTEGNLGWLTEVVLPAFLQFLKAIGLNILLHDLDNGAHNFRNKAIIEIYEVSYAEVLVGADEPVPMVIG